MRRVLPTEVTQLLRQLSQRMPGRSGRSLVGVMLGVAIAALSLVAVAVAGTFTLRIAKDAPVINTSGMTSSANIVINPRGWAVYELSGDSKSHPKCRKANGCFAIWPPITVSSAKRLSKAPGIKGKLGVWKRNGLLQVTLGGHPLYRFALDQQRRKATGQGLRSFHGTWRVLTPSGVLTSTTTAPSTTTTQTASTPTSTTPCLYPPCTA